MPSCKVCKDAGKSEQVYTSHSVKDRDSKGKQVCPTLSTQKCRRCFEFGHTVKYCTRKESIKTTSPVPVQSIKKTEPTNTLVSNRFSAFDDDTDDEDQDVSKADIMRNRNRNQMKDKPKDDFPALSLSSNVTLRPHQMNWAAAIANREPESDARITVDLPPSFVKISEIKIGERKIVPLQEPTQLRLGVSECDAWSSDEEESVRTQQPTTPRWSEKQRTVLRGLRTGKLSWADVESDDDDDDQLTEVGLDF